MSGISGTALEANLRDVPKPVVSVVVPTRDRAGYLDVTLRSLADQDFAEPYEVIVVDDGSRDATTDVVARHGVRLIAHDPPRGPNAARNAGMAAGDTDLVAFVDDDVFAPREWLRELVEGARRHPDAVAFGGPIRARLEGPAPRSCGRELPPVTTLDLGAADVQTELVWSANMLVRRAAVELAGEFDPTLPTGGDEEEWLRRLGSRGGKVIYIAAAALDHRRVGDDARLRSLMRSAYHRGYNLRRFDETHEKAPGIARELRVFAGSGWHALRRACPQGLIAGAHSAGRLKRALGR
jgi:glycosyltransferase involved in cell wall biosynthesis